MSFSKQIFTDEQNRFYESLSTEDKMIYIAGYQAALYNSQRNTSEIIDRVFGND